MVVSIKVVFRFTSCVKQIYCHKVKKRLHIFFTIFIISFSYIFQCSTSIKVKEKKVTKKVKAKKIIVKEKTSQEEYITKIAILKFINQTHSRNYNYIKNSLSSPIYNKMSQNFYLVRPNIKKIQKYADKMLSHSKRFKKKKLKKFAKLAKVDFIIFGYYTKMKRSKKYRKVDRLKITAGIYSVEDNKIIVLLKTKIFTNSTMFISIDNLSKNFVIAIRNYILKQEKKTNKKRKSLIIEVRSKADKRKNKEVTSLSKNFKNNKNPKNSKFQKTGKKYLEILKDISFNMIFIQGGLSFKSKINDSEISSISKSYLIGETEVTYELWQKVYSWSISNGYIFSHRCIQGSNNSNRTTDQHPVTTISWRDALLFTNALTEYYNKKNKTDLDLVYYSDASYNAPLKIVDDEKSICKQAGCQDRPYIKAKFKNNTKMKYCIANGFRLPTKAEWSFASKYKKNDKSNRAYEYPLYSNHWYLKGNFASGANFNYHNFKANMSVAVYHSNSGLSTAIVKSKKANSLGIYDMSGNVWEWNFDWHPDYHGSSRILRGGSWNDTSKFLQIGYWFSSFPYFNYYGLGFRLARTP